MRKAIGIASFVALVGSVLFAPGNLASTGGPAAWASQTFPLPDPVGGHHLYLVFRSVPGGATGNNLFLLNWVEFGGDGVASSGP
jgi:hypothetical protein